MLLILFSFSFPTLGISQLEQESKLSYGACGTDHEEHGRDETPNNFTRLTPICTDPSAVKYVSVNIHFVQTDFGTGNFRQSDDGNGNPNYTGYDRARDMVNHMNNHIFTNYPMRLPCPNTLPNPSIRIQYVLKGVYFDRSSFHVTAYGPSVQNNTFGKNKDTEVNIFLVPCHNCHIHNVVNGVTTYIGGVAPTVGPISNLTTTIYQDYNSYLTNQNTWDKGAWGIAKLINHEIGHLLDLRHAWRLHGSIAHGDYCTDTPLHPNCWNVDAGNPSCNTLCKVSNNLMDYNFEQNAVPPPADNSHTKPPQRCS